MLSREQVETILATHLLCAPVVLDTLLSHDAALRDALERSLRVQEQLAANVNVGLLEIRGLKDALAEAERQRDAHADLAAERRRALAQVTGRLERLLVFVDTSQWHKDYTTLQVRCVELEKKNQRILEASMKFGAAMVSQGVIKASGLEALMVEIKAQAALQGKATG